MPVLEKKSNLERVYLPSTKHLPEEEQAFVDIESGKMTTGDVIGVDPTSGEVEVGVRMLVNRIKGWNFTDSEGKELEINFENVQLLEIEDFSFLAEKLNLGAVEGLSEIEKKT
jgi:hypothetical protein